MPIRLLRDERIAVDGVRVRWYRAGDIISVSTALAAALIRDGIASTDLQPKLDSEKNEMPVLLHEPKQQPKPLRKREYRTS